MSELTKLRALIPKAWPQIGFAGEDYVAFEAPNGRVLRIRRTAPEDGLLQGIHLDKWHTWIKDGKTNAFWLRICLLPIHVTKAELRATVEASREH